MSNVEARPELLECGPSAADGTPLVLQPRQVPLGGPRAMPVRRTLPQRGRSLIGAWCFADHYGPTPGAAMRLPGHPHTGLQTVSWLFAGLLEHLDTIGSRATIRPGELNLMTAGKGIAHSEFAAPDATLHGVQLWVALPDRDRFIDPRFEHYAPEPITVDGSTLRVFLGSLAGSVSPVVTSTPLLGAQLDIPTHTLLRLDVAAGFEHGLLVDAGEIRVSGVTVTDAELLYVPGGATTLTVETGDRPVRAVLLGGEPLGERIVMWWNFVARTHDEIVAYRAAWQRQRADGHEAGGDYGTFPTRWDSVLAAPELPNAQLHPRS